MYLDIGICVFVLLCAFLGWRKGFMRGVLGFISSVVTLVVAIFSAKPVSKLFNSWFGLSDQIHKFIKIGSDLISVLVAGVIVYLVVKFLFFLLSRAIKSIKKQNKIIDKMDKVGGIFLGLGKALLGLCIMFLVLQFLNNFNWIESIMDSMFDKSYIGKFLFNLVVDYVVPLLGDFDISTLYKAK